MRALRRFRSESGGTSIEHGLLAALIALVCLFAFDALGTNLTQLFGKFGDQTSITAKP